MNMINHPTLDTDRGYVTMRNADGTHWLTVVEGTSCWTQERRERSHMTRAQFDALVDDWEARGWLGAGDYGIHRPTFHPEGAA